MGPLPRRCPTSSPILRFVSPTLAGLPRRVCCAVLRSSPSVFFALLLGLGACSDDSPSAPTDAAMDDGGPSDAGTPDAFVREMAPACAPLPEVAPPACGSGPVARNALIPGAADPEHDADLAAKALRYERLFHGVAALFTGVNTEMRIPDEAHRAALTEWLENEDGWDFAESAGEPVEEMVAWAKVAGAYGGVGAATDAFRYAVLRDEGAPCDEIDRARQHVVEAADALHRATAITGVPGVIARGFQRKDRAGYGATTVPLFDGDGNPLPEEKDNGTWREDNSGEYPEYAWEDSCSRDMLVGWVIGMAGVWEVIARDPAFDDALKERLASDAEAIARMLMRVGEAGNDLEIHDADGRLTYHAYLHESAIDRAYIPGFRGNGQHAAMALGIMAALARISGEQEVADYVHNDLLRIRRLDEVVEEHAGVINFGTRTNFSNYNMTFDGVWLASRYLCEDDAREAVNRGIANDLYANPEQERRPDSMGQSFFDFVYLAAQGGAHSTGDLDLGTLTAEQNTAFSNALGTLGQYPNAPFWNDPVVNCDEAELEAGRCIAIDGETEIELDSALGRGDHPISVSPMPMRLRPVSNFYWRSDPFRVNDARGDGTELMPGVDFRFAYWMGRYLHR